MYTEILLNNKIIKRIVMSLIISILITSALTKYSNDVMAGITDNVIRLHIIANSNSERDQRLKLIVRDDISKYMAELLRDSKTASEAQEILNKNIHQIENRIKESIISNGFNYNSRAYMGSFYFPQKKYENSIFPSGNYNALKVVIGNGMGHNWWCILYPQLCFEYNKGDFTREGDKKLKNTLSDEQYQIISDVDGINFRLKIVELFSYK